jgi:pimeloyl-ACP methyl ester carboxylesterase
VTITAEDINYIQLGSGQSIIMLHGWNRSLNDLKPLAEILAEHANVYVLDLPGFGKTPPPPVEGWDTSQYSELIVQFIKSKNLDKVVLIGHSFGGRISLRIAARYPEKVERIILIDSHGLRPVRSFYQNLRIHLIKKSAKLIKFIDKVSGSKFYQEKFAKRFGSPDYQNAGILKNTFVKTISEDQTEDVAKIEAKSLLLWGSEDRETPLALARKFNQLMRNSKLIILEGKDHSPFHGVGSHLCANHIIKFLEQ